MLLLLIKHSVPWSIVQIIQMLYIYIMPPSYTLGLGRLMAIQNLVIVNSVYFLRAIRSYNYYVKRLSFIFETRFVIK